MYDADIMPLIILCFFVYMPSDTVIDHLWSQSHQLRICQECAFLPCAWQCLGKLTRQQLPNQATT